MELPDINATVVDLQHRLKKLEKEKEELAEKFNQLKADKDEGADTNLNIIMEKVLTAVLESKEEMKTLHNDIKKIASDSVMAKYETQAVVVENKEALQKGQEELLEKFTRLTQKTEKETMETIEQLLQSMEESIESTADDRHETVTELITELQEEMNQKLRSSNSIIVQKFTILSEKVKFLEKQMSKEAVDARQQTIAGTIIRLQRDMQSKIDESHKDILQKLIPLRNDVKYIEKQVDKETILLLGGLCENMRQRNIFVYKGNKWIELSLKLPKSFAGGAVYLNGEIYIFGGSGMTKELYKLDRKELKWQRLADMHEEHWDVTHSYLEWNGFIWIFGGWNDGEPLKSVERYDPKENKWIKITEMAYPRTGAAVTVHNGKFIICGGYSIGRNHLKNVECYDPEKNIWTELPDLPSPRWAHFLVSFENRLLLIGGNDRRIWLNTTLELVEGVWKELSSMKYARDHFAAAVLDKKIHLIGGRVNDNKDFDRTETFDGERWKDGPLLPSKRRGMAALVIPNRLADILCKYSP